MDPAQTSEMDRGPEGAASAAHCAKMTTMSQESDAQTDAKHEDEDIDVFMAPDEGASALASLEPVGVRRDAGKRNLQDGELHQLPEAPRCDGLQAMWCEQHTAEAVALQEKGVPAAAPFGTGTSTANTIPIHQLTTTRHSIGTTAQCSSVSLTPTVQEPAGAATSSGRQRRVSVNPTNMELTSYVWNAMRLGDASIGRSVLLLPDGTAHTECGYPRVWQLPCQPPR